MRTVTRVIQYTGEEASLEDQLGHSMADGVNHTNPRVEIKIVTLPSVWGFVRLMKALLSGGRGE
jgi:hypothetical protein